MQNWPYTRKEFDLNNFYYNNGTIPISYIKNGNEFDGKNADVSRSLVFNGSFNMKGFTGAL